MRGRKRIPQKGAIEKDSEEENVKDPMNRWILFTNI